QQRTSDTTQSASFDFGAAGISPQTGNVRVSVPLDFRLGLPSSLDAASTLEGEAALVYNADTVNVKPIIEATQQSDAGGSGPSSLQAQLTWNNGTPQSAVTFGTTGHAAGDVYLLSTQVANAVSATGVYPWSVQLTASFTGDTITRTLSGNSLVIANGSS